MDEHQALLGRTVRPSLFAPASEVRSPHHPELPPPAPYDAGGASSSEGSDSWWGESHSSCSSCSGTSESSEEDWEDAVTEQGELLYVQAAAAPVKPGPEDKVQPSVQGVLPVVNKQFMDKQGKFVRWIRRRESKRQRPRLSLVGEPAPLQVQVRGGVKLATLDLPRLAPGKQDTAVLGLRLGEGEGKIAVVQGIIPDGPLAGSDQVTLGDYVKTFNSEEITLQTLEKRLNALITPCQVVLGFQKGKEALVKTERTQSKLVQRLLEGDAGLHAKLAKLAFAVLVVDMAELREETADSDLVFCYPPQSHLAAGRGAFITLSHLLPSVVGSDCRSCTCEVKGENVHVVFSKEDDLLLLLAIPDRICRVEEARLLTADLVRCICFSHQTLQCCFRKDPAILLRFFSAFFSRVLSFGSTGIPDVPLDAVDPVQHHFHQFLSAAPWVPLPREAQLQLDDALNELESCDFGHSGDDALESERQFIVLGSCLYHQACLLTSHLTKDDLLDVHSFLRVQGILDLSRSEGVSRMVLWREVFPHSVNRGLPPTAPVALPPPVGRWFLLIVSTGHDMLAVVLENAGCCLPLPRNPRPHPPHVREAEDTLAHVQSLGLTSLAAQWLSSQARPRTTVLPSATHRPLPKDKAWGAFPRPARSVGAEAQDDTFSQAASNVSNPSNTSNASESDENAPILGRRAERTGLSNAAAMAAVREPSDDSQSDSSDSDSDWGSFKGLSMHDNGSGIFDNPYLPSNVGDLDEITSTKVTSGPNNQLFHFVHVDGNEGVVITPADEATPPTGLMAKFTAAAHNIHTQLQHNVRFRAAADPRGTVNKSLIAVKECGILLDLDDGGKCHWVVGRLFFTPKPREVYVCYSDDAPQNMLELAFRLGLGVAG